MDCEFLTRSGQRAPAIASRSALGSLPWAAARRGQALLDRAQNVVFVPLPSDEAGAGLRGRVEQHEVAAMLVDRARPIADAEIEPALQWLEGSGGAQ